MQTTHNNKPRIAAGLATLLIVILLLVWLCATHMQWPPPGMPMPQARIVMAEVPAEEFLEVDVQPDPGGVEDMSSPAQTPEDTDADSQPGPESGDAVSTRGRTGDPAKAITADRPSPVSQTKSTPTKPAAAVENKKQQEERAASQRTKSNVSNAFANASNKNNAMNRSDDNDRAGKTQADPESAAAPSATGTRAGISTGTVGGGWRIPAYSRSIPSNEVGSVTFDVAVNKDGSVGKITQISTNGLTPQTIARCRDEIRRHRFTHGNPDAAEPTTARITFTFRDPA